MMDRWMDGWKNRYIQIDDRYLDTQIIEGYNGQMDGQIDSYVDRQMIMSQIDR